MRESQCVHSIISDLLTRDLYHSTNLLRSTGSRTSARWASPPEGGHLIVFQIIQRCMPYFSPLDFCCWAYCWRIFSCSSLKSYPWRGFPPNFFADTLFQTPYVASLNPIGKNSGAQNFLALPVLFLDVWYDASSPSSFFFPSSVKLIE